MAKRRTYTPQDGLALKWKVIGYTLLVAGIGTAGYVGYRVLSNRKKVSVEKESLESGDPANMALRLKKAFDNDGWFGTNEEAVYQVMQEVPSKTFYRKVMIAYRNLTGNELNHDLDEELSLEDLNKVQEILANKPEKSV
jgi:hypothetical protein